MEFRHNAAVGILDQGTSVPNLKRIASAMKEWYAIVIAGRRKRKRKRKGIRDNISLLPGGGRQKDVGIARNAKKAKTSWGLLRNDKFQQHVYVFCCRHVFPVNKQYNH